MRQHSSALSHGEESLGKFSLCCILSSRVSNEVGADITRTCPEKAGLHPLTSCSSSPTQLTPQEITGVLGTRQRREDMTSRGSNNWHTMITFQGQELSWTQGTEIALWTKSQRLLYGLSHNRRIVFCTKLKPSDYNGSTHGVSLQIASLTLGKS